MAGMIYRFAWALVLFCAAAPLVAAQQAVATIDLPGGKTVQITFTTVAIPGQGFTGVEGINSAGDVVGYYAKHNTGEGPWHSFLLTGGTFTFFDYPAASSTYATGINDSGLIVGYAGFSGNSLIRGFLYDLTNFTSIKDGSNTATYSIGINNSGYVVGGTGSIFITQGFELRGRRFQNLSPPGSYVYVYDTGINNFGEVVGWTDNAGFAYKNGAFQTIQYPGASKTEALGVNDNGTIVGWYMIGTTAFGFALINGQYTSFGYPGAVYTLPRAINSIGQVVGEYSPDYKVYYGFITSPIP